MLSAGDRKPNKDPFPSNVLATLTGTKRGNMDGCSTSKLRPFERNRPAGGRVEPGSASSRCHRAGVEPGLRTRCCQPRVQAGRLGARARAAGRPLRARETVAQQGCLSNLREHQQQRDVRSARQWKEELGRGAVGSSCREGLCSWQRISQFWAPAGKEGLLGLETLWCNKRWPVLLRHGRPVKGSKS